MRRREFIMCVGGGAIAWPLTARAQQPSMPVIGYLHSGSFDAFAHVVPAFREGLKDAGYVEGQNAVIEYRWADGHYDRLRALAADLVSRHPAVIAAAGGTPVAVVAKAATSTIPIVFLTGADPIQLGLVTSLNKPGGNLTGIVALNVAAVAKRLELLHQLAPTATVIALLGNPTNPFSEPEERELRDAAHSLGLQLRVMNASTESEIEAAFAAMNQAQIGALVVSPDPFLMGQRSQLAALALRHMTPAIADRREFVAAGGLMSYGTDQVDVSRQMGLYVGRILNGAKPADLPVQQVVKLRLVINLKTATALRLEVPDKLLALTDEVIE
jgi:putative tryptophan/tyrosine transport system substrate-binding protein